MGKTLKKSLGQHLLTDREALERIAEASGVGAGELCLEIGPGTGNLTSELLSRGARVTAVEIDSAMVARLAGRFAGNKRLTVVNEDILAAQLDVLVLPEDRPAIAVGNLPYYITSPIVFQLLDNGSLFRRIVVMVQREVAMRICAGPGSSDYGVLSVFCGNAAECKLLFRVPAESFRPPPKVDSAVVELIPRAAQLVPESLLPSFQAVVHGAFTHRRKTLQNSLRHGVKSGEFRAVLPVVSCADDFLRDMFSNLNLDGSLRPQQFSIGDFMAVAEYFQKLKAGCGTD